MSFGELATSIIACLLASVILVGSVGRSPRNQRCKGIAKNALVMLIVCALVAGSWAISGQRPAVSLAFMLVVSTWLAILAAASVAGHFTIKFRNAPH